MAASSLRPGSAHRPEFYSRRRTIVWVANGDASDGDFNCAENGVLATVVGVVGTIMATEAIKMITNIGQNLAGFLLVFDAASMEFRKLKLPRNPDCTACGDH